MAQAGPELQIWEDLYAHRGLVPWGVAIQQTYESARDYWIVQSQHTHPWAADLNFTVGQFFPGPWVLTPAYILIDLCTMTILDTQEGYTGSEEELFLPYLDRTCPPVDA